MMKTPYLQNDTHLKVAGRSLSSRLEISDSLELELEARLTTSNQYLSLLYHSVIFLLQQQRQQHQQQQQQQ